MMMKVLPALLFGVTSSLGYQHEGIADSLAVTPWNYIRFWESGLGSNLTIHNEMFAENATLVYSDGDIFGSEAIHEVFLPMFESNDTEGDNPSTISRVLSFQGTHKFLDMAFEELEPEQVENATDSADSCPSAYDKGFAILWEKEIGRNLTQGLDIVVLNDEEKIAHLIKYEASKEMNASDSEGNSTKAEEAISFFEMRVSSRVDPSKPLDFTPVEERRRNPMDTPRPMLPRGVFGWLYGVATALIESIWEGTIWKTTAANMANIVVAASKAESATELGDLLADNITMTINGAEHTDNRMEIVVFLNETLLWSGYPDHFLPLFVPFFDHAGKKGFLLEWIVPGTKNVTYKWAPIDGSNATEENATEESCAFESRGAALMTVNHFGKIENALIYTL